MGVAELGSKTRLSGLELVLLPRAHPAGGVGLRELVKVSGRAVAVCKGEETFYRVSQLLVAPACSAIQCTQLLTFLDPTVKAP